MFQTQIWSQSKEGPFKANKVENVELYEAIYNSTCYILCG